MKNLILLFILIYSNQLLAQSLIRGSVTDIETGEALLFANVAVYKGKDLITGTQTDFDGYFNLKNIPPGEYNIEASYSGYTSSRWEKITVSAEEENVLHFELEAGVTLDIVSVRCCYCRPLVRKEIECGTTILEEEIEQLDTSKSIEPAKESTSEELFTSTIYPNPATDLLSIKFLNNEPKSIQLVNSSGILLDKKDCKNQELQIDVSQFQQGIYFLKIETETQSKTEKIIITH